MSAAGASRTITIGVDARCIAGQPTGVGRYVVNLLRAAAPLDDSIGFRLILPSGATAQAIDPRIEASPARVPGGSLLASLDNVFTWTHLTLPLHLARRPVDLLHAPFYTLPAFCPAPAVVTIHDITFALHPEWFTRRARLAFTGFAGASARKARHVLTVSERSRSDIMRQWGLPGSKVTAVPLAPDPAFSRPVEPAAIARVRAAHGLPSRYLLHVGSITPRRNLPRLLDALAMARAAAPDLALLVAGRVEPPSPPLEEEVRRRGLGPAVRLAGYLPEGDLPALYAGAAAVVYPSLYEGFGLPVLEAMASGSPVLASNTSCFPEVAGEAALLVDPLDTGAIAAGIVSLVTDEPLRRRLVEAGRARAAGFTWERTARATLAVYRAALSGRAEGR